MLNVTKKAVSVLLIFILCITLNSCHYDTRVNFSELIRRMNSGNVAYSAAIEDAFYSEGEWFLFTDTLSESDILITAKEDADKILTDVSVSTINNGTQEQKKVFCDFSKRLINAFTENYNTKKIIEDSGIDNTDSYFTEGAYFSENGRFSTSLYTSETGCSFIIKITDKTQEIPETLTILQ